MAGRDKLFIDTWGWICLFNRRERRHRDVRGHYQNARKQGEEIFTTDYVLDEVNTLIFKRIDFETASIAFETIFRSIDEGYLQLIWVTRDHFELAHQLRVKFRDKPDISFTDLTTMVVMQEFGLTEILTGDSHFLHVGMGFALRP
ncbi:MAG TPA: PIN domain-containing protein [Anaerolineae bacterium]|nr:PIN domain-containing protein [Anaerolineae bacterium]